MNCPACQQGITRDARFCSSCGFSTALLNTETDDRGGRDTNEAAPSSELLVGRVLDSKYELVARLGEGGMGTVYRARRLHIGDEVAVKILHQKLFLDEQAVERFRREARSAAMISHANIVTIHDFYEARVAEGAPAYIVMELVRGVSLRELLQRAGRLRPERAVALMRDICAGVGVAHRHGLVHRDLKPDNVIVEPPAVEGEGESAKVVDFGIAKLRDMTAEHSLTQTGAMVGTPFYMPPEQCRDEPLDTRADVYSLGAMLYEMLAGAPPFRATSLVALISKHLNEPPPPFPPHLGIPPALETACRRALSKTPSGRQPDATALGLELQKSLAPHAAISPTPHEVITPPLDAASMRSTVTVEPSTLPASELLSRESSLSPRQPSPSRMKWVVGGLLAFLMGGALLAAVAFVYVPDTATPDDASAVNSTPVSPSITQTPTANVAPSSTDALSTNEAISNEATDDVQDDMSDDAPANIATNTAPDADAALPTANGQDLKGKWTGTYGPMSQPATLLIKEHQGGKFNGVLEQGATRVEFSGTVDAASGKLRIKETRVLRGEGWSLGDNAGELAADGQSISGTGKDAFGAQLGMSYEWSFSR